MGGGQYNSNPAMPSIIWGCDIIYEGCLCQHGFLYLKPLMGLLLSANYEVCSFFQKKSQGEASNHWICGPLPIFEGCVGCFGCRGHTYLQGVPNMWMFGVRGRVVSIPQTWYVKSIPMRNIKTLFSLT